MGDATSNGPNAGQQPAGGVLKAHIGKYELLASIGEGGMARVFLARQQGPMGFQKIVVIKTIHPHLSNQDRFVKMFLDEARIAAHLSHPNVVQVYDLGVEGGTYFIVMEYLPGEAMTAVITRGIGSKNPLEPLMAASIVSKAAGGLHSAHDLKDMAGNKLDVVHRDVSHGNIIVLYDGDVKLVDFGVAKARGRLSQTVGQQMKGKFAYMSPEQIGDKDIDRRSDGAEELLFAVVRRGRRNAKRRVTLSRFRPGEDRGNENVKLTADSLMGLATQLTNHTKAAVCHPIAKLSPADHQR